MSIYIAMQIAWVYDRALKAERERERDEWQTSLTLACRDVAVSPVDAVFMICYVAPRQDVAIWISAETEEHKSDHNCKTCSCLFSLHCISALSLSLSWPFFDDSASSATRHNDTLFQCIQRIFIFQLLLSISIFKNKQRNKVCYMLYIEI